MIRFFSFIISSLAVYFVNGWVEPYLEISIKAMLNLIVFILAYMLSSRYLKNLLE